MNRSVLLNKISKANKMILEYAYERPKDHDRSPERIAEDLTRWKTWRDALVTELNGASS